MNIKENAIKVLNQYNTALRNEDLEGILSVFSKDSSLMIADTPNFVGIDAVKTGYEYLLNMFKLDIEFHIDDVQVPSDLFVVLRTHSTGKMTLKQDGGKVIPELAHEIFVMKRASVNEDFKIFIYNFSNMPS